MCTSVCLRRWHASMCTYIHPMCTHRAIYATLPELLARCLHTQRTVCRVCIPVSVHAARTQQGRCCAPPFPPAQNAARQTPSRGGEGDDLMYGNHMWAQSKGRECSGAVRSICAEVPPSPQSLSPIHLWCCLRELQQTTPRQRQREGGRGGVWGETGGGRR
jgi:hypothetical protein